MPFGPGLQPSEPASCSTPAEILFSLVFVSWDIEEVFFFKSRFNGLDQFHHESIRDSIHGLY